MQGVTAACAKGHRCIVVGDMIVCVGSRCDDVPTHFPEVPAGLPPALLALEGNAAMYVRHTQDAVVTPDLADHLMHSLQASCMVLLNGRAPGGTTGQCTCIALQGRAAPGSEPPRSVVELAAVTAEGYASLYSFQVVPLDTGLSPDHCMLELSMQMSRTQSTAASGEKVQVHRPAGLEQCSSYRRHVAGADQRLAAATVRFTCAVQLASCRPMHWRT
jgi:hypothetical protein